MRSWSNPNLDKSRWPAGEWDDECDKAQWVDEKTGLNCLMVRNHAGAWCGYVGVHEGHSLFGKFYDDTPPFEVHGGLTFADSCREEGEEFEGVCHVPLEGEPKVWWLGFDCGHSHDLIPGFGGFEIFGTTYRSFKYVKSECELLALQIKTSTKS